MFHGKVGRRLRHRHPVDTASCVRRIDLGDRGQEPPHPYALAAVSPAAQSVEADEDLARAIADCAEISVALPSPTASSTRASSNHANVSSMLETLRIGMTFSTFIFPPRGNTRAHIYCSPVAGFPCHTRVTQGVDHGRRWTPRLHQGHHCCRRRRCGPALPLAPRSPCWNVPGSRCRCCPGSVRLRLSPRHRGAHEAGGDERRSVEDCTHRSTSS